MALHLGEQLAKNLYVGKHKVERAYVGSSLIYQSGSTAIAGIPSTSRVGSITVTLSEVAATVYMEDTFTGTNGALWDATKWASPVGEATYTLVDLGTKGEVAMPGAVGYAQHRRAIVSGLIPADDFQIEWDFILKQAAGDVGWLFRANDIASVYYELRISGSSSTGRTRLFRRDAAGTSVLVDVSPGTGFTVDTAYRNRIQVNGNRIRCQRWPVGGAVASVFDHTDPGTAISGTGQREARITAANPSGDSVARSIWFDNVRILEAAAA